MKSDNKKAAQAIPVLKKPHGKQTSGDKSFDNAIDRMLKPKPHSAQAK